MKEEFNSSDPDFKLENGNNCFIGPRKSKEQITIDKALNFIFLGLCFWRQASFRRGEIQKERAKGVGIERAWAPWNLIWVDGHRVATWDSSQEEVVFNFDKLKLLKLTRERLWEFAQQAERGRSNNPDRGAATTMAG